MKTFWAPLAIFVSFGLHAFAFHTSKLPKLHGKATPRRHTTAPLCASLELESASSLLAALPASLNFDNADISTAFSVATFFPQPFWLLMILLPNWKGTKAIMGSWLPVITCSLVHLFIVIVSASQVGIVF